jgi:hypothetical protein
VKKVEYLDGYRLRLHFNDGKIKVIDMADELKGAKNKFRDLKDIAYFKKVKCDGISIIWPNEIDFCPDWLYMQGEEVASTTSRRKKVPRRKKIHRLVKR